MKAFDEFLKDYARLALRVGLNLQKGQRLIIHNASTRGVLLHVAPLVREITREAYEMGAPYVDVIWNDEELIRTRVQYAPEGSFNLFSDWQQDALMDVINSGGAMLTIRSNNPDLLSGLDPERVGTMQKAYLEKYAPVSLAVTNNRLNWLVIAASGPQWAARVFPDLAPDQAQARLWEAIFQIIRLDQPDPVAAWEAHVHNLLGRSSYLTARNFTALKYRGPGTDLTVGLPSGHRWISAREKSATGIQFIANMPTEEVFTLPHLEQTEGTVAASLPLSYGGTLIEDFSLTFEKGRVIKASARKGEAILRNLIETDEGSHRLGEVALVPVSSPIARRGHLFYDTLIDENAASHLAVGRAYRINLEDSSGLTDEQFMQRGGNVSLAHVDFMIGSKSLDIDGIREDGSAEPIMRAGDWAFDI
jgi:aminopeptidase